MNNDERKHRYAMMGVVAYVEERIDMFKVEKGVPPAIAVLGRLEWEEVLRCKDDEDFSVAGIPCVPDLTCPQGVFFSLGGD